MSGIPAGAGSLLGKRLGKYEILALLALGGTAEIYLARIGGAAGFEKYVVVKCLHDHLADDPEFVKMFLDEARLARAARSLEHRPDVRARRAREPLLHGDGVPRGPVARDGRAARGASALPGGKMPVPLIAQHRRAGVRRPALRARADATNGKPLNIVHRDISPQNLVISFEGVVKVVDFGIAKAELRETKTQGRHDQGQVRVHVARAVRRDTTSIAAPTCSRSA